MLKVKDHQDLYRDESSGAILNLSSDYDKYIQNRNLKMQQAKELETLKSEVTEIKQMMSLILDKLNK
jgi:K+/H+ antiporter YhaU regulatory subunit KhtT